MQLERTMWRPSHCRNRQSIVWSSPNDKGSVSTFTSTFTGSSLVGLTVATYSFVALNSFLVGESYYLLIERSIEMEEVAEENEVYMEEEIMEDCEETLNDDYEIAEYYMKNSLTSLMRVQYDGV
jgi:hypothetical protein